MPDRTDWITKVWKDSFTRKTNESLEALDIDDSKDRSEIASMIGLTSLPDRKESNIDALIGMFDSTVEPDEEVDVTEWVKSIRKRSS